MTIVSNCGHDERGQYKGGQPGDQTGDEWALYEWFDFGQNCVARYPDPEVRSLIADLAKQAAQNDHIGYNQEDRLSFWEQLKGVGWQPKYIEVDCAADCSSGVAAIIKCVGYLLDNDALRNVPSYMNTYNEVAALSLAGFQIFSDDEFTRSGENLLAGDIIIREDMHTNIVVEGDGVEVPYDADVAYAQAWLNIQLDRRGWTRIEQDGSYGPKTAKAVIEIAQDWMLNCLDPTVTINGSWYLGWQRALDLNPIRQGMACAAVTAVKAALIGKGYKGAALNIEDWTFSNELVSVVKQFQTDHELPTTGRVDSDTFFAMTHDD